MHPVPMGASWVFASRPLRFTVIAVCAGVMVGVIAVGASLIIGSLGSDRQTDQQPNWPDDVTAVDTSLQRNWIEMDELAIVHLHIAMNAWNSEAVRSAVSYALRHEDPFNEAGSIEINVTMPGEEDWTAELALPLVESELSETLSNSPFAQPS